MCLKNTRLFFTGGLFTALLGLTLLLTACGDSPSTTTQLSGNQPAVTTAAATGSANGKATAGTPAPQEDRKIIRNATITLTTENLEKELALLRSLASESNGLVFQENTQERSAVIVIQVPGQSYEAVINRIRQSALKVTHQETSTQDVTEEYVDLRSQITNLQRTEEGLQKLVDKATRLDEILSLQKEMTAVRGEIEKRQGRLNFLDKRAAFSTITINITLPPLTEPAPAPPAEAQTWQPAKTTSDSWNASLKLLGSVGTVLLQQVVFFWWLLPFLIPGVFLLRRRLRRTASRRAESVLPGEAFGLKQGY